MAKGRKPKPIALKLLTGNPGGRPLDLAHEARVKVAIPSCPKWLVGEGRREWFRLAPLLKEAGLLTELDRGTLVQACSAWARYCAAEQRLAALEAQHAEMLAHIETLKPDTSDHAEAERKANKVWGYLCTETGKRKNAVAEHQKLTATLGMSPQSRSGIKIADGQGELPLGQPESAFDRVGRMGA